ncbi:EamA family transporter [Sedimentibacter sp. zth1]|uniref:EamA family transporter n=1 Tax=Sedimentibacter sp. zth1 TaxID=2816908 RepID=UPI001A90E0F6|nr:EamA family transporter [Sedimentibacter sp. zth1]QSX05780.1 EamA family transporter [Sedimentibacter sp. zth1]
MIYLICAIACSSSIALIFKYTERNNLNRYQVTVFNYLTASIISLFMVLKSKIPLLISFSNPFGAVVSNFTGNITDEGSSVICIVLGIVTGILYLVGFLLYQVSIRQSGASLASMFNRMGILIPMILSIVLWNEYPTLIRWIGITITVVAIIIVNLSDDKNHKLQLKWNLLIMFFVAGFAELSNKLFQKYAILEYKNHFLFFLFFTAFIISVIMLIKNKNLQFSLKASLCGIAVGIPNMLTTFFVIEALDKIQAMIVYPAFSAGSIALIMLLSILIYKEKLKKNEIIALCMTLIGIILVNI